MTDDYYHQTKGGGAPPTPATVKSYVCSACGYGYDPVKGDAEGGIAPGTPFLELPAGWICPVCGAPREAFLPSV